MKRGDWGGRLDGYLGGNGFFKSLLTVELGQPQLLPQPEPLPFFRRLAMAKPIKVTAVTAMMARVIQDCQLEDMGRVKLVKAK